MISLKRILSILMLSLLTLCLMPSTAYGASAYSVEKVEVSVDLRSDGNALVTEEWTVNVGEDCNESFVRNIVISDDNFERIAGAQGGYIFLHRV